MATFSPDVIGSPSGSNLRQNLGSIVCMAPKAANPLGVSRHDNTVTTNAAGIYTRYANEFHVWPVLTTGSGGGGGGGSSSFAGYKAQSVFYQSFISNNSSGLVTNLDSLPSGIINKNGADDISTKGQIYFRNLDTGRYVVSGIVPAGYNTGDVVNVAISGYMNGTLSKLVIPLGVMG